MSMTVLSTVHMRSVYHANAKSPKCYLNFEGKPAEHFLHSCQFAAGVRVSLMMNLSQSTRSRFVLSNKPFMLMTRKKFSVHCSDMNQSDYATVEETHAECPANDFVVSNGVNYIGTSQEYRPSAFRNRYINLARLGSVLKNVTESFFKSEIRRRLFMTAILIAMSRVGYFIPLPGFDRRLIPKDYLSFATKSVEEFGNSGLEIKMSLFQLGISPHIMATILIQVMCYIVPSLMEVRKEGLAGQEKIKSYIWWSSFGFAILEALVLSCISLNYSIFAASYRVKHVIVSTFLLVVGAMTTTWICDTITEFGFGQGISLIICVRILTSYTETLYKMLSLLSGSCVSSWPYILAVLGCFTAVTMWAIIVTEGCRKVKLTYYGFKLDSKPSYDSHITEVEPYIPLNINPMGMQPIMNTSYILMIPSILANITGLQFWAQLKHILDPETSIGAAPWVYYSIYAFFVFYFNILDIANVPKEISDYMNKMGAKIPKIKPGKATIEYLIKIQASTRFWGGLLLSILATTSSVLDHYLRHVNSGFAIGITSVLIIVGSIIELRRSYQAYNVMPSLSKALSRYGV